MEEERERENILLHPSVSAFLDDKNMACQSQSRVKECVCSCVYRRGRKMLKACKVQVLEKTTNNLCQHSAHTLTQNESHTQAHAALCVKCDGCSGGDRLCKMRLIID